MGCMKSSQATNVLYYSPKNGVVLFGEMFSKDWKNQTDEKRSMIDGMGLQRDST